MFAPTQLPSTTSTPIPRRLLLSCNAWNVPLQLLLGRRRFSSKTCSEWVIWSKNCISLFYFPEKLRLRSSLAIELPLGSLFLRHHRNAPCSDGQFEQTVPLLRRNCNGCCYWSKCRYDRKENSGRSWNPRIIDKVRVFREKAEKIQKTDIFVPTTQNIFIQTTQKTNIFNSKTPFPHPFNFFLFQRSIGCWLA